MKYEVNPQIDIVIRSSKTMLPKPLEYPQQKAKETDFPKSAILQHQP